MSDPEDTHPLLYSPTMLADARGNVYSSGIDDPDEAVPGEEAEYIGLGVEGPMQDFILTGVYNGQFRQGPPDPTSPIGDNNPLPYWTYSGDSAISARWVTSATAPGGYGIEFTVLGATGSESAYLEQIVPISPRGIVVAPEYTQSRDSDADISWRLGITMVDKDGAAIGSEQTHDDDWTTLQQTLQYVAAIPDTARYVRYRMYVVCTGAVTSTMQGTLEEFWAGKPNIGYVTICGSGSSLPATGFDNYYVVAGNHTTAPVATTNHYLPPPYSTVWVTAVTARLSGPMLGASSLDIYVYDNGTAADTMGTPASINPGGQDGHATSIYNPTTNSVRLTGANDVYLRFRAYVFNGTLTNTSDDIIIWAHLAYVVPYDAYY